MGLKVQIYSSYTAQETSSQESGPKLVVLKRPGRNKYKSSLHRFTLNPGLKGFPQINRISKAKHEHQKYNYNTPELIS